MKSTEGDAYKAIEGKLKDTPATMDNARKYVKDMFQMDTNPLLTGQNEQGIPTSLIKQQHSDYIPPITTQSMKDLEEANPNMPARDYGIFAKILRAGGKEDLTANDIKQFRTVIGDRIDWNAPRSNEVEYHLKNLYKALGDDYTQTAENAGFGKEARAARQATKNVYGFLDKGMVQKVGKAEFPEDIITSLQSKDSPSRIAQVNESLGGNDVTNVLQQNELKNQGITRSNQLIKQASSLPGIQPSKLGDVIPKQDQELNSIMSDHPSKVIDNLFKNNTQEVADAANRTLDKDSLQFIKKGIGQKLIRDNTSPSGKFDLGGFSNGVKKLQDSGFLDSLYGKDSQEYKTLSAVADFAKGQKDFTTGRIYMPWKFRMAAQLLGKLFSGPGSESGVMNMAEKGGGMNLPGLQSAINKPSYLSQFPGRLFPAMSQNYKNESQ